MAYETGQAAGAEDLLVKLQTFAVTHGWNADDSAGSSSDKLALSKGNAFVSFRYDSSDTTGAQIVSVHQATGHTPAALPGDHPGDSGNGYNQTSSVSAANLDNGRHVDLGLSPDELDNTYHFFEQDASEAYIHVVVVRTDGQHRHFGFGDSITKFGVWTGGAYAYGHFMGTSNLARSTSFHSCLLDGAFASSSSNVDMAATIRIAGFPGENAASVWGEIMAAKEVDTANDSAGNPKFRIQGGYRGGPVVDALGGFAVGRTNGFINLIPIHLFAYVAGTPNKAYRTGELQDVRGIILDGIAPGEELLIGTETWVCFPSVKKSTGALVGEDYSLYQGIAYRKETA